MITEMRFKDSAPEQTVQKIKECLAGIGIELKERLLDAGIGNCYSMHVWVEGAFPLFTNGKGVTPELARASAYGEFIERLQCGLFLYKFQSINRDRSMAMHYYAPDGKYMTMEQIEEQGDWMDDVINAYGNGLTRKKLAQQCKMYACTEENKIWTVPYYSLFEDKYVDMPVDFVEQIYASNGCCAGNTREEAWVHALSEIMERNSTIRMMTTGEAAPCVPDEVLNKYEIPRNILKKIEEYKDLDVTILDFSNGSGFPVIGVRLINKKTQGYLINTAADPILEIALSRGLTEIFQGKVLDGIKSIHGGNILVNSKVIPLTHNILNQIENGNGQFSLNFFTEEVSCTRPATVYHDNSGKNNKELLAYMLQQYKDMGKKVYVRNVSFLGFPSYYVFVPGFSESRGFRMIEKTQEYALADMTALALRDLQSSDPFTMAMVPTFFAKIQTAFSRRENFPGLSGTLLDKKTTLPLLYISLAWTSFKMGNFKEAERYTTGALGNNLEKLGATAEQIDLLQCFRHYLKLKNQGIEGQKQRLVMEKFFRPEDVEQLYKLLEQGTTPLDQHLLKCDTVSCEQCQYNHLCTYSPVRKYITAAGEVYRQFIDGQSAAHLKL